MSKNRKNTPLSVESGTNGKSSLRTHRIFLFILTSGVILRIWNITWGLPQLYEEAIPLRFGMRLWDTAKDPIDFHFFVYPALSYYVHFAVQAVHFAAGYVFGPYTGVSSFLGAYRSDPTAFVLLARLTTVAFDAGTLVLVYLLALRIADRRTALIASVLLAINPLHISEAHLINVDTVLSFFAMWSVYCIFRMYEDPAWKWYLLSGVAVGCAAATKYNGVILAGVLIISHLLRSRSWSEAAKSMISRKPAAAIVVSGIIFILWNPLILTHFGDFSHKLAATEEHMELGHLGLDPNTSTFSYYLGSSLPENLGWPLAAAAILSIAALVISRERKNILLALFPLIFGGVLLSWQMRADRYILPLVPILILAGAAGAVRLGDYVSSRFKRSSPARDSRAQNLRGVLDIATLILLGGASLAAVIRYERTVALPDTRSVAREWIRKNIPRGAAIATGPFGIELSDTMYLSMPIQFTAVASEALSPFYRTAWYEEIDLLVASDYDYGRYRQEPQRFGEILQFYDSLRAGWKRVFSAEPNEHQTGPALWLYTFPGTPDSVFSNSMFERLASVPEEQRKVDFLGKLGLILMVKGKLLKSEQLFEHLLEIRPDNGDAHDYLAQVLFKLNKYDKAVDEANYCLGLNPRQPALLAIKGKSLFVLEKLDEAEIALTESLSLNPRQEDLYETLAFIYGLRGDNAKVIEILTRWQKILPPSSRRAQIIEQQIQKIKSGS